MCNYSIIMKHWREYNIELHVWLSVYCSHEVCTVWIKQKNTIIESMYTAYVFVLKCCPVTTVHRNAVHVCSKATDNIMHPFCVYCTDLPQGRLKTRGKYWWESKNMFPFFNYLSNYSIISRFKSLYLFVWE